jgi:PAS domain S-box-containing protein
MIRPRLSEPLGALLRASVRAMSEPLPILLIEDVETDALAIERELKRHRPECVFRRVETREGLLDALEEFRPRLILSDFALPRFDALDVLRTLREQGSEVPVILVTGTHTEEVALQCMEKGADDYILKASLCRLPSAVDRVLENRHLVLEHASVETALKRSEAQFQLITENTRDLILLLDLNHKLLYASPSFQRVLELDPAALTGQNAAQVVHAADLQLFQDSFDEARFFREPRTAEIRFRHRNGTWLEFESIISFIFNEQGQPQRALIVSRDTTERQRVDRELRKMAAFPQYNPNPVLEFNGEGELTYFNDAAAEMARSLQRNHPQAILPFNTATIVRMCLATRESKVHLDSSIGGRTLSWSFYPVMDLQVVHAYAEDITDSLNMEAQLRQALKMESVGQLAAGVAHDFNNILTVIHGHAGLLLSDPELTGPVAESARQITAAAERAATLTRQLLVFSRKQVMQPQLLDLREVLDNLAKMLRALLTDSIAISRHATENLPAVHADPGMIEQVILNLAVNARDAMPRGGKLEFHLTPVEIEAASPRAHPEARPGYYVCLRVTDTGHGMNEETMAHIFEPFFTTKEIGKGTGLGLATAYGIAKQHQGWIEVQSAVGQGTTFQVFFPATVHARASKSRLRKREALGGHETILVVEDEPALRELVLEILQKKGYRVLQAPTGAKALPVWNAHKHEIKLLLTDMMMPQGVSGRDLAEQLLAEKGDLKVIYSSGYSLEAISPDFAVPEGVRFLQKPYDPETLAEMVRECLNE